MSYVSCEWIEYKTIFNHFDLLFCCKPFSETGGYVKMIKFNGGPLPVEKIQKERDRIRELNSNDIANSPCRGCHLLEDRHWPELHGGALFKEIHVNNFTICNLRCVYCYTVLNKHDSLPKYTYPLEPIIKELIDHGYLTEDALIVWGGGEPTILNDFSKIQELLKNKSYIQTVATNAVTYSPLVEKGLRAKRMWVVTSIDSGTSATYNKIKGRDCFNQVWEHLRRYQETGGGLLVKYIMRDGNSDQENIKGFIKACRENNIKLISIGPDVNEVSKGTLSKETIMGVAKMAQEAAKYHLKCEIQYDYFTPKYSDEIKQCLDQNLGFFFNCSTWFRTFVHDLVS